MKNKTSIVERNVAPPDEIDHKCQVYMSGQFCEFIIGYKLIHKSINGSINPHAMSVLQIWWPKVDSNLNRPFMVGFIVKFKWYFLEYKQNY